MQVVPDSSKYGWGSREWILKNAIPHLPQEQKDATLQSLVTFLVHAQNYTNTDVLDLLTQGVLTGEYRQTMDYGKMFTVPAEGYDLPDDGGYPEHDNPENPLSAIDEEEIRRFTERMENWATGEDPDIPPSGKPEGWDYLDE